MPRPGPVLTLMLAGLGLPAGAHAAPPMCPLQLALSSDAATAAIPAPPPAPPRPEDSIVNIDSDHATVGVDGKATLRGNVQVTQGARHIHANEMQYDRGRAAVRSDDHIDYRDPLVHITGANGSYSAAAGAAFHSAQFSLIQRSARGTAQDLLLSPDGVLDLKDVTFTTCPPDDQSWALKARDITLDTRSKIGTARHAQIDFMGVPLMYLPWVSFPLSGERKSGFLFPSIGNTSTGGAQLTVPYYWNIAPNADFTFEPTEYTKRGVDAGGDLRWLSEAQRGELDWNYLPYDSVFGASRSRERLKDVMDLPWDLRLTLDAANVSDTEYFEDFSQGPEGASTAFLDRSADLTYRTEHWYVDGQVQQYQTIDIVNLAELQRPYARLPRLVVNAADSVGSSVMLRYGFDSEVVDFHRNIDGPDNNGWRADLMPRVGLDLTGPGYFLRPNLAYRVTQYELDSVAPGQYERAPSRALPVASVDAGLQFEKYTGSHDQRKLTLEPRVLYLYVPYRDQNQLPVFDTAVPDLNPVELFRDNRYVGADRMSDANQVAVGVTSRLLDAGDGRQFLAATLGQAYYFTTPRVTLPFEAPATGKRSDVVAQISLTAFQDWSADVGVQWDPENQRSERTLLNLQYKPAENAVINFAYRYERFQYIQPDPDQPGVAPYWQGFDQLELSGAWPIRKNWDLFIRDVYALRDYTPVTSDTAVLPPGQAPPTTVVETHGELERFVGIQYRSCCWRLRLGVRRFVNNHDGSQDTGIWLQLELAGLAGVGSASDAFLSEEIRGYRPLDATTPRAQGPLKSVW
ncbi:MAG TPA: LPS assembly protein LptD [Steroidobacteraceae bacterium]|nr:LPS assembly protein LptD [Steroidobacteraceae bacterium]